MRTATKIWSHSSGAIAVEYILAFAMLLVLLGSAALFLSRSIGRHAEVSGSISVGGVGQDGTGSAVDMRYQLAPCGPNGRGNLDAAAGECY